MNEENVKNVSVLPEGPTPRFGEHWISGVQWFLSVFEFEKTTKKKNWS